MIASVWFPNILNEEADEANNNKIERTRNENRAQIYFHAHLPFWFLLETPKAFRIHEQYHVFSTSFSGNAISFELGPKWVYRYAIYTLVVALYRYNNPRFHLLGTISSTSGRELVGNISATKASTDGIEIETLTRQILPAGILQSLLNNKLNGWNKFNYGDGKGPNDT